jgi:hypothetical protein
MGDAQTHVRLICFFHGLNIPTGAKRNSMSAQSNLSILAAAAGLGDEEVAELWVSAQEHAISNTGSVNHPKFRDQAETRMVRLIEDQSH